MKRPPLMLGLVVAVAVCSLAAWMPRQSDGFQRLLPEQASAVVGGACKNPIARLVCGNDGTHGCVEIIGKSIGTSEGTANENKFACIDPTAPLSEEEIAACGHTHKKCATNDDF
ncbi:MAG: hypothetical protein ACK58T_40225 [Phycisphaerae bacterium]|jgi:hypothetical protein